VRHSFYTLVPIRPRRRGERRFILKDFISRRISPPITPRCFQSRNTSAPFNSASDAFERLHPDIIARMDNYPHQWRRTSRF
jgi:hypothetical protein